MAPPHSSPSDNGKNWRGLGEKIFSLTFIWKESFTCNDMCFSTTTRNHPSFFQYEQYCNLKFLVNHFDRKSDAICRLFDETWLILWYLRTNAKRFPRSWEDLLVAIWFGFEFWAASLAIVRVLFWKVVWTLDFGHPHVPFASHMDKRTDFDGMRHFLYFVVVFIFMYSFDDFILVLGIFCFFFFFSKKYLGLKNLKQVREWFLEMLVKTHLFAKN